MKINKRVPLPSCHRFCQQPRHFVTNPPTYVSGCCHQNHRFHRLIFITTWCRIGRMIIQSKKNITLKRTTVFVNPFQAN